MNRNLRSLILGMAAFAATPALADAIFFEHENFSGRQYASGQSAADFRNSAFNDRARSAIVEGGSWEVCMDINFGGGCTVFAPGRYANLGEWSGRVSSARMVVAPAAPAAPVAYQQSGGITFYGNENFGGRQMSADRPVGNLGSVGFNDRAQSAIVEGGSWEICANDNFSGNCTVLAPGRYPTLGGWSGSISSARPATESRGEMQRDRGRGRASATLFSGPNFSGRQLTLGGEGANDLDGQFNDRASSLRVDRGYWIFCSDNNFRGECQTFGPGEYRNLPSQLDNRISSGRRISHDYPYSQRQSAR